MSVDCCGEGVRFEGLSTDYKRRLWIVIAINASMFLVEMAAGALAGSQALQADALDFLGDATTYGIISLAVIGAAIHIRARAAVLKALSLIAMALWVLGSTAYHVLILGIPRAEVMGGPLAERFRQKPCRISSIVRLMPFSSLVSLPMFTVRFERYFGSPC